MTVIFTGPRGGFVTDAGAVELTDTSTGDRLTLPAEDRTAYWTTISQPARQFIYMMTDGRPGIL